MLSYQHVYHAGNFVDCQKHIMLSALLSEMQRDPLPLVYIDTHAGRGLYDLAAPEAARLQEYRDGIDRLWALPEWPIETELFENILQKLNPDGLCRYYPGSPYVAQQQLRQQDRAELYELHPQEFAVLKQTMSRFENAAAYQSSGWDALQNIQPSGSEQGIILIDPSYELKDEYPALANHVKMALQVWPSAVFVIWYPLLAASRHIGMLDLFRKNRRHTILQNEMIVAPAQTAKGLYGTGLLIINPPPRFEKTVERLSQWLTFAMGRHDTTQWLSNIS